MHIYDTYKFRNQVPENYLKFFLENEIKVLWPQGWIQTRCVKIQLTFVMCRALLLYYVHIVYWHQWFGGSMFILRRVSPDSQPS
jgi:hypothetical protein